MRTTYGVLAQGALTGSLTDLATVPTGETWVILAASFCNDTGGALDLTVKLVDTTAGTARTITDERNTADKETYIPPGLLNQVVAVGGKIQGMGDGIDFYISGLRVIQ